MIELEAMMIELVRGDHRLAVDAEDPGCLVAVEMGSACNDD